MALGQPVTNHYIINRGELSEIRGSSRLTVLGVKPYVMRTLA